MLEKICILTYSLCYGHWDPTGLFSIFYLSLRLLFWGVPLSLSFPSNSWILRRYPMLPRVLSAVLRVVQSWGGREGQGNPCVARSYLQPHIWCYLGVQFNLPAWFRIPGPSPDPVPAGDWISYPCRSSVIRTSQRRLWYVRLRTPILAKGVLPFSLS